MKKIKTYIQYIKEEIKNESINESFTLTLSELPSIGDIVDRVDWKEGEKMAFIDFKGVKNIPVQIVSDDIKDNIKEEELEETN